MENHSINSDKIMTHRGHLNIIRNHGMGFVARRATNLYALTISNK